MKWQRIYKVVYEEIHTHNERKTFTKEQNQADSQEAWDRPEFVLAETLDEALNKIKGANLKYYKPRELSIEHDGIVL